MFVPIVVLRMMTAIRGRFAHNPIVTLGREHVGMCGFQIVAMRPVIVMMPPVVPTIVVFSPRCRAYLIRFRAAALVMKIAPMTILVRRINAIRRREPVVLRCSKIVAEASPIVRLHLFVQRLFVMKTVVFLKLSRVVVIRMVSQVTRNVMTEIHAQMKTPASRESVYQAS